ncbi:hypothetical protein [Acidisphaera sp. L21]|jgi:hypothetical protein|uniref:hypothetical protein n=1 Tax=Acidisphaera sp. L21 TaxID=1641851 RepID=UPI00131B5256|nr:hypothetical protein [Acidisphaera sp. L21]
MLRAGEVFLALAPILAGALLYGVVYNRLPTRRAVLLLALAECVVAGLLIWTSITESMTPHEPYVPARIQNGQLVDGHGG